MFSRGSLKVIYDCSLELKVGKIAEVSVEGLDGMDVEEGEVRVKKCEDAALKAEIEKKKAEIKTLIEKFFAFVKQN